MNMATPPDEYYEARADGQGEALLLKARQESMG
jgi:hypothetical protein